MLTRRTRNRIRFGVVVGLIVAAILGLGVVRTMNQSSQSPAGLGVDQGRLAPCPNSPNCVSTQSPDPSHRMEPLPWDRDAAQAIERWVEVIESFPRTQIVQRENDYLHVEFRSFLFRFVDDVEIWIDTSTQQIHFRSASRIGYSDLGANRKRMTALVEKFQALP